MKKRYYIYKLPLSNPNWCRDSIDKPQLMDYIPVWTDEIEFEDVNEALERLFFKFNVNHPEHYAASSLSVSDLVAFKDLESNDIIYYRCAISGWKKFEIK